MPVTLDCFFDEPGGIDLPGLAAFLDGLDGAARRTVIRQLDTARQALLFEAAEKFRPIGLDDLVPAETPVLTEVIHDGRNTMPVLPRFQKRLVRPESNAYELWGYNEHPLRPVFGPGYFVATASAGEITIDYTRIPPREVNGWPRLRPNSGRCGLVYGNIEDVLRGVSAHVFIGRASKAGKPMDAWFVLTRA